MPLEENGNSFSDRDMSKVIRIVEAILRNDIGGVQDAADVPLADESVFRQWVDISRENIDYAHEDLRPHMRVLIPDEISIGSAQIYLKHRKTGLRDIVLQLSLYPSDVGYEIFVGSIVDKTTLPFYEPMRGPAIDPVELLESTRSQKPNVE